MPVIKDALTPINHRAGGCTPKWIVVHYFGALGSAASVAEWFKNPQARASAHYAVDEGDIIYRCVKDTDVAWHCGDGTMHPECRNWNSIGVELRPKKVNPKRMGAYDTDWFFEKRCWTMPSGSSASSWRSTTFRRITSSGTMTCPGSTARARSSART